MARTRSVSPLTVQRARAKIDVINDADLTTTGASGDLIIMADVSDAKAMSRK